MVNGQLLGITASVFTGISLLPQLLKIFKEKKPGDISLWMLAILFTGLMLWIGYGIIKNDWIIIVSNCVSLVINGLIVFFNLKYKHQGNAPGR